MYKTVALALAAGLLGGMLSRYIAPPAAYAQNQAPQTAPMEIRAQSFVLVDKSDQTIGTFSVIPGPLGPFGRPILPRIVLRDSSGREIWSAGGSALQPLTIK
jgi:hypothetical protein